MKLHALAALAAMCLVSPASAIDVLFNGTVADTCTLAVPTPGTMRLSASGTVLASSETLGVPATATVISLGGNTVRLSAPTLVSWPTSFTQGSEVVEMNYSGLASHPAYTNQPQVIPLGILPLTNLIINMRVTNAAGFTQGAYQAKTVLTCS